jgi:hypothetical protein
LVGTAIKLAFRQVQRFVQRATAGATARDIWAKNVQFFVKCLAALALFTPVLVSGGHHFLRSA